MQGRSLHRQVHGARQARLAVAAGLYLLQVRRAAGVLTQNLTVL